MEVKEYIVQRDRESRRPVLVVAKTILEQELFINNPREIVEVLEKAYGINSLAEECAYAIMVDNSGHVIGVSPLSHGISDGTLVGPKEFFFRAISLYATGIALAHVHPSGGLIPSGCDIDITRRLYDAGKLLNIRFLDHIIIGNNLEYYSFRENKQL